jgi:hypothetical protein
MGRPLAVASSCPGTHGFWVTLVLPDLGSSPVPQAEYLLLLPQFPGGPFPKQIPWGGARGGEAPD